MISEFILAGIPVVLSDATWTTGCGVATGQGLGDRHYMNFSGGSGSGCGRVGSWIQPSGSGRGTSPGYAGGYHPGHHPQDVGEGEVLTWSVS